MNARTTTALSLLALTPTLALVGCNSEEAPAPEGALESIEQQAAQQTASQQGEAPSTNESAPAPAADSSGTDLPMPDTSSVVATGDTLSVGGLSMSIPTAWAAQTPDNQMRAAQYSVDDTGEFVVFINIGGGVEPNMTRWIGQIGAPVAPPERDVLRKDGITVHTVTLTGTYQGMAGPATSNTTFYGAIIEGASTEIQIRLTVDADRTESDAEWDALIASIARN